MPREDFEQLTEIQHMLFSAQLKREISQKTQNFIVDYLALSVVGKDNALPLLDTLVKTDAGAAGNRFVNIREFIKRLRRLLQRQRHIKTELFGPVFCGYPKLVTSDKIREVSFCLLDTNGSHAKAKNERRRRMNVLL